MNESSSKNIEELEQLKQSAEKLSRILDGSLAESPAGIIIADAPSGSIRIANAAATQMRGRTESELKSRTFADHIKHWQFCHPNGALLMLEENPLYRAIVQGETIRNIELLIRRDDGTRRWILANAAPIKDEQNNIIAGIMVFPDISLQKKAEEALRHSEENLHITLNAIGDAVVATDALGIVTRLNPAAEALFGISHSEACGAYLPDIISCHDSETLRPLDCPVHQVLDSRRTIKLAKPVLVQTRETDKHLVTCTCSPILSASNSVIGSVAVFGDVTEATKNQERLRQIEKMELIGRLAGGVAHDLNNLITPLLGYSEILLVNLDPDNPQYTTVDSIRTAAEEARRLTEQLLSFGRRQVVDEQVVDVHTVLSECEDILRHSLREDIDIRFDLQAANSWVKVDASQIKQALVNLALNAQESMPDGGSIMINTNSVNIDASQLPDYPGLAVGEFVTLSITDTGVGMDKRQLDHLFEPYFLNPTGSEGTGLGLASVYGILRRHKGLVTADSTPGKGSCFTMMLPASEPAETEVDSPHTERRGPKGQETVAVVEDDLLVRELTSRILREHGYTVYDAESPSKCLELFERVGQDVVLLVADVVMPEMNGRELYETLSQKYPALKVLYMSGYTDRVIARHGVLEQGVNLLQKPFSLVALASKVRAVLDDE